MEKIFFVYYFLVFAIAFMSSTSTVSYAILTQATNGSKYVKTNLKGVILGNILQFWIGLVLTWPAILFIKNPMYFVFPATLCGFILITLHTKGKIFKPDLNHIPAAPQQEDFQQLLMRGIRITIKKPMAFLMALTATPVIYLYGPSFLETTFYINFIFIISILGSTYYYYTKLKEMIGDFGPERDFQTRKVQQPVPRKVVPRLPSEELTQIINKYIDDNTRPAIEINRRYSDNSSNHLSYFGGTPTLPNNVDWPKNEETGIYHTFLGQINFADLPKHDNFDFPSQGIIYFFADINAFEDGNEKASVIYTPDLENLKKEDITAPQPIARLGEDMLHGGYTFKQYRSGTSMDLSEKPYYSLPKLALDFRTVNSICYPQWKAFDHLAREDRDELMNAIDAQRPRESQAHATAADLGILNIGPSDPSTWSQSTTGWPWFWGNIELIIRRALKNNEFTAAISKYNGPSFEAEKQAWLNKCQASRFAEALSKQEAQDFREWLIESIIKSDKADTSKNPNAYPFHERSQYFSRFSLGLVGLTTDALSLYLDNRNESQSAIPTEVLAHYQNSVREYHQMEGHGRDIQGAAARYKDKVLLLELMTDYGMLTTWADCGGLQFWIDRDKLKHCDFSDVIVTLEG